MATRRKQILVADDDIQPTRGQSDTAPNILIEQLQKAGYDVQAASTSEEAIRLAEEKKWDIAIVDLHWKDDANAPLRIGWDIIQSLRDNDRNKDTRIILYSGYLEDIVKTQAANNRVIAISKVTPRGPRPGDKEQL